MNFKTYPFERIPVVYNGRKLMPCTLKRARVLLRSKRAIFIGTLFGGYLKLKTPPSDYKTQGVILGIDPGSQFHGFTIVTKRNNFNYEHWAEPSEKKSLKARTRARIMYRRIRRIRLRHRSWNPIDRGSSKLNKLSWKYLNIRTSMVNRLFNYFPISKIVIEDQAFISEDCPSANSFIVGKSRFYKFCEDLVGSNNVKLLGGRDTSSIRKSFNLEKSEDKGESSFNAHCVDSLCLGLSENLDYFNTLKLNTKVICIRSNRSYSYQPNKANRSVGTFRQGIVYLSKLNRPCKWTRSKKFNNWKSNHGPWDYISYERVERIRYPREYNCYGCRSRRSLYRLPVNGIRTHNLCEIWSS